MKTSCIFLILCLFSLPLFAQTEIAPGAVDNLAGLLNKPTLVRPVKASVITKNWYYSDLDSHVITDQASFKQIVSVLIDIENYGKTFDGKSTKLRTAVVSRANNETITDITSITIAFIRFTIRYRATIKILENNDTRFIAEVRQTDNTANDQIRNYNSIRYAEDIIINGKNYAYLRVSSQSETHVGINLNNIPSMIEKNSESSNRDTLNMIIEAAKLR